MDIQSDSPASPGNADGTEPEKKEDIPFKKPILVGKIGHLPKKIKNISIQQTAKKSESVSIDIDQDSDTKLEINSKKTLKPSLSPSLQYVEPPWAGQPEKDYNFEVLKDGSIIETINLDKKTFWVFGRLSDCDIFMQHPTVSRYHAVLQYRSLSDEKDEAGFYIYDLGSTHGTFLNKNRLRPRIFVRMQVGHILKIGCSTRSYLLNGPEEDSEKESEFTVTELKQKRKEDLEKRELERKEEEIRRQKEEAERLKREEERGIDWGMGEDAEEETDLSENPFAQSTNEELYLDDPKKTLRGFFEREGLDLTYDCSEQGMGQFMCKVELPIDDERGRPIYAEVIHKGKKKEAVIQCALEACRILDRHDLLRQAVHESRKRKVKDWAENDYYDSDDDTFLDRTGTIEKKREKRMNAKKPQKAETYESLIDKERTLNESIKSINDKLKEAQQKINSSNGANQEEDPLDAFMNDLKQSKPDKSTINKLKNDLAKLRQEHAQVIKLVNLVRPADLPPLVPQYPANSEASNIGKNKILPVFGKRKKVPVLKPVQGAPNDGSAVSNDETEEETEMNEETKICEVEYMGKDHTMERTINSGVSEENETVSSEHLGRSLLEYCEDTFKKLSEKIKLTVTKISSLEDEPTKAAKFQSLLSSFREETNKLTEVLNNHNVKINNINETNEQKSMELEETEALPIEETGSFNSDTVNTEAKKKKNQRRIQQRQEKLEIEKRKGYKEDAKKEDYNMWLPPPDQTGDGRTKLNEKFGY